MGIVVNSHYWGLSPMRTVEPSLDQLENAIKAAKEFQLSHYPHGWKRLQELGWQIKHEESQCGGNWVWVDRQGVCRGCLCHHTPSGYTNIISSTNRRLGITKLTCENCNFEFDRNVKAGDICPDCGKEITGVHFLHVD